MKITFFINVTCIFLVFIADAQPSLQSNWPLRSAAYERGSTSYNNAPVLKGFILMKNGDTLKGKIKLIISTGKPPSRYAFPFLQDGKNGADDIQYIGVNSVNYFRVFNDSVNNTFTDIVNVDNRFWRLLGKKNRVAVYEETISTSMFLFNRDGRVMFVSENKPVIITSSFSTMLHGWHIYPAIINFINKRYHKSFKENDFKTGMDMIDYILNNENEKEH
jgi:hypothetical protein